MSGSGYLTLAAPARAEVEAKRSRFICDLARVATEGEARAFIEQVRAGSGEARHHCTAFVLGPEGAIQRSNDDGEPSGTAGAPMLEVLRGRGLSDVVAVVTRWFGGTLLGTGGLIRAYGDAVQAAVDAARLVRREQRSVVGLTVSHAAAPRLENALRNHPAVVVTDIAYAGRDVTLRVATDPAALESVRALVAELSSGGAELVDLGHEWVDAGDA
ncbi:MAG TPA: YigZ family protein [Dermatophilaceae bacterium]|nr:YigZ family protein [Dermatophilaceae bacterium]